MTRPALPLCLGALLMLAACASLPDVAMRESAVAKAAAYPTLAPMPDLLAAADAPGRATTAEAELEARAARLRARAAGLRQMPAD
ncbi:hypothetical protein SAMN05421774_101215 [Gemmobacter megaterium]|uniref:DUF4398 domain-containing protein n=1 Tax=Gemmobacter megaterium TaxID=1086013 RepID=A0A1N7K4F3_9RHOB|nr:hypothetical protein [Gemmobacter megaterium]GGE00355.1 hypothetical protein GCM10011345_02100 [Gemmobacter megaterium]SIS56473.1 hypothetical protein SAMN05421774_101215 [Gemmobacter megaterium]